MDTIEVEKSMTPESNDQNYLYYNEQNNRYNKNPYDGNARVNEDI